MKDRYFFGMNIFLSGSLYTEKIKISEKNVQQRVYEDIKLLEYEKFIQIKKEQK